MGTHRSKHNKGRKPFYKEHNRTTLADIAPVEARGWQEEAADFFEGRRLNIFKESRHVSPIRETRIKRPEPQLTEAVKRYLDVRRQVDARKAADQVFPTLQRQEFSSIDGAYFDSSVERVHPSNRDVLMELFASRKISVGQLHAGRRWQAHREWATIQPNMTIDWSGSVKRMPYQRRGDLTEGQHLAMRYRRQFHDYAGPAAVAFLDFCLDADRGRDELINLLRIDGVALTKIFDDLLLKLCGCYGSYRRVA